MTDPRTAERLRRFAEHAGAESPLYGRLAHAAADDPLALDILQAAQPGQPPANILLAAVQYLLLDGRSPALAAHYPALAGDTPPEGDPVDLFHRALEEHRERVTALVAAHTVQTNEVRRCTTLLPCFTLLSRQEAPLALIEVGASAGLNLVFDRYRYDYGAGVTGPEASPLLLTSEIRSGAPPIPSTPPVVSWRVGLDLQPVDVADPDSLRWARALIWPEQIERVERFETAVGIAAVDPPPLRAGDALDLLPAALDDAPGDATVVVYHSYVLNQWDAAAREHLDRLLADRSTERPIDRISVESLTPGLLLPEIIHRRYEAGEVSTRLLGRAHHHGEWLEWED